MVFFTHKILDPAYKRTCYEIKKGNK